MRYLIIAGGMTNVNKSTKAD